MGDLKYPVRLSGKCFTPIWSGDKLSAMYPRFKELGRIGESWETSVDDGNEATVHGKSFKEYLADRGLPIPPLVKLIDAGAPLSIQVHPDETVAAKYGSTSKSEIWYVLDAKADSFILYGTNDGITLSEAKDAILHGDIEPMMHKVYVKAGDVFMIPPGMIHSLGAGITVLEVQDAVGTTYRVKDISGNRETHAVESADSFVLYTREDASALAVSDKSRIDDPPIPGAVLACTDGYVFTHYTACENTDLVISSPGTYMFCERGGCLADVERFVPGDSVYFPSSITVKADAGSSLLFVI